MEGNEEECPLCIEEDTNIFVPSNAHNQSYDSAGQPGRVGGGGEEEERPGGDHDQHGWDVVQEDVPLPPGEATESFSNCLIISKIMFTIDQNAIIDGQRDSSNSRLII